MPIVAANDTDLVGCEECVPSLGVYVGIGGGGGGGGGKGGMWPPPSTVHFQGAPFDWLHIHSVPSLCNLKKFEGNSSIQRLQSGLETVIFDLKRGYSS